MAWKELRSLGGSELGEEYVAESSAGCIEESIGK